MNKKKFAKDVDLESFSENFMRTVQAIKGALTDDQVDKLTQCADFKDVFKLLWGLKSVHDVYNFEEEYEGKCSNVAKEFREKGNTYFSNKSFLTALREYNKCIFNAPFPPTDNQENESSTCCQELAYAYGNRSACLFNLGKWSESLKDVTETLRLGVVQKNKHKLLHRAGACCLKMGEVQKAKSFFESALHEVENLKEIDEKSKNSWIKTLQKSMHDCVTFQAETSESNSTVDNNLADIFSIPKLTANAKEDLPECCSLLRLQEGGEVLADKPLQVGNVLTVEKPLCSVYFVDRIEKQRCYKCFTGIDLTPTPCLTCSSVAYCSPLCRNSDEFHKLECKYFVLFTRNLCGDVGNLAMKLLTQHGPSKSIEIFNKVMQCNESSNKNSIGVGEKELRDYEMMLKLKVMKWEVLKKEDGLTNDSVMEFLKSPVMVIYLMKVLFVSGYMGLKDDEATKNFVNSFIDQTGFYEKLDQSLKKLKTEENVENIVESNGEESKKSQGKKVTFQEDVSYDKDNFLSFMVGDEREHSMNVDEMFSLAELLHKHVRIIRRHARLIRESGKFGDDAASNSLNIGIGMYPRMVCKYSASCDPTAELIFYQNTCVVRAIRRIHDGEPATLSFAPLFYQTSYKVRRKMLLENHSFVCGCDACVCKWPVLEEIFLEAPSYRCSSCRRVIESQEEGSRFIVCSHCGSKQSLEEIISKLQSSYDDYALSMNEAMCGNHFKALHGFEKHLNLLQTHILQPWPDFIATQAAIKACLRLLGNVKRL